MPRGRRRTPTICAEAGCPEFATYRGRCPKHRLKPTGTGERGSTYSSRKRRAKTLADAKERCYYCTAPATIEDHYFPLALGGEDDASNTVAACVDCNRAKADRDPVEFMASSWLARRCADVARGLISSQ